MGPAGAGSVAPNLGRQNSLLLGCDGRHDMQRLTRFFPIALFGAAAAFLPRGGRAQSPHSHGGTAVHDTSADTSVGAAATHSVNESMSGRLIEAAHLEMTPARRATAADSARAAHVLAELRRGLTRYEDYRNALDDGYKPFFPNVPQPVYHFTSYGRAVREAFTFDPSKPSSLLYEKMPGGGGYRLVGAMYSAPARMSLEQ